MSRLAVLLVSVLAVLAVAGAPADAAKRRPSCQQQLKGSTVADTDAAIIAYRRNGIYGVCSTKLRRKTDIAILDDGERVAQVYGTKSGTCAVVRLKGGPSPELALKDLKANGSVGFDIGSGATAVALGKVVLTANCVAVWADRIDGTSAVHAQGILPGSRVGTEQVVSTTDAIDLGSLTAKAAGSGVVVTWTQAGQPQRATLPSAGASAAAKRKPSCASLVKRAGARVVERSGPLTVYQRRDAVGVCDAKLRKRQPLGVLNPGTKVTDALGVRGRCAFVVAAGADGKPDLYFKDLSKRATNTFPVGFGRGGATVGSIALSSNCAAAWGEQAGGVFRIRATGITGATSLGDGTTDLATVAGPDDIAHVTAKAAGRKVTVGWTTAGTPQSLTIPL